MPNLNLNFNSTQKDEEMELYTTAGKKPVGKEENSIAVVVDQEIDALQINYTTVASDIELTHDYPCPVKWWIFLPSCVTRH